LARVLHSLRRQAQGRDRGLEVLAMFPNVGEMMVLLWRTLRALPQVFRQRQKVSDQLFEIGNASLLMACILSLFIGGVITLQTGPELAQRGLSSVIGGMVGLSICKELAPVMMARSEERRVGEEWRSR